MNVDRTQNFKDSLAFLRGQVNLKTQNYKLQYVVLIDSFYCLSKINETSLDEANKFSREVTLAILYIYILELFPLNTFSLVSIYLFI